MRRLTPFLWLAALLVALTIGLIVGARVMEGVAGREAKILNDNIADVTMQRDDAVAELEANKRTVIAWDALSSFYTEASSGGTQANGRPFDEDRLTAAHRSLKFGTILILENPANGALSVVRIEDRGPAEWTGRSLDVSLAVARRLGIVERGVARVRCYVLVQGRVSDED
jgi:rare lipoprotein A (peptidoglycan hydrolase)